MKSDACNRPYPFYEGFVIDRLVEAHTCSPEFLDVHLARIRAAYDLGRPPEEAVETMQEIWRAGQEIGAAWTKPVRPIPANASKAMQDTQRFLDAMKRKGLRA